jgi:hypothetical protein
MIMSISALSSCSVPYDSRHETVSEFLQNGDSASSTAFNFLGIVRSVL